MNPLSVVVVSVTAALAAFVSAQDSRPAPKAIEPVIVVKPSAFPAPGAVFSVGRRPAIEPARAGSDTWICGDGRITTALPVGYPAPTAPGAIELKSYPALRKAEVTGTSRPDLASNVGFWKLFRHITERKIAMTAPVEMEYSGLDLSGTLHEKDWSMAFLYREPALGPTGPAGDVAVVDSTPATYLSVGALGSYGMTGALRVLGTLRQALSEIPSLEAAGSVRVLHYNGPEVRDGRRWFEVQVPVRWREASPDSRK